MRTDERIFFTPALPTGKFAPGGDRTPAGRQGALLSALANSASQPFAQWFILIAAKCIKVIRDSKGTQSKVLFFSSKSDGL